MEKSESKPLFRELNADDPDPEVTEVESLCMSCHENGVTRLLLTKIPYYKEIVIMSFSCEHCGYQNNEIQSSGQVNDKGIRWTLNVNKQEDLNRQVVKSDYTSIKIVEVEFEVPSKSQKGEVTTIEGIIQRSINGLEQDQVLRRIQHPEAAEQIDAFIEKLKQLKSFEKPFTVILEDISGNSFIENPNAPSKDVDCTSSYFTRTKEQNHDLGLFTQGEISEENQNGLLHPIDEKEYPLENFQGEVLQFRTNCNNCGAPCETNMKVTNIPHFKEVVIMATICEACGHRTNEVKSSGGIEEKGIRIEVTVKQKEDFSRDVLKSETCSLGIPTLDLEVGPYALGGRFTTVEGLLIAIKEQLSDPSHSRIFGDSTDPAKHQEFNEFIQNFDRILNCEQEVTIVLDDPAGNSYIQSLSEEEELDENLKIVKYERTFEQNEDLGLNDMNTENYS